MNTVHQLIKFRNQSFYLNINDFQSINILQYTETKSNSPSQIELIYLVTIGISIT